MPALSVVFWATWMVLAAAAMAAWGRLWWVRGLQPWLRARRRGRVSTAVRKAFWFTTAFLVFFWPVWFFIGYARFQTYEGPDPLPRLVGNLCLPLPVVFTAAYEWYRRRTRSNRESLRRRLFTGRTGFIATAGGYLGALGLVIVSLPVPWGLTGFLTAFLPFTYLMVTVWLADLDYPRGARLWAPGAGARRSEQSDFGSLLRRTSLLWPVRIFTDAPARRMFILAMKHLVAFAPGQGARTFWTGWAPFIPLGMLLMMFVGNATEAALRHVPPGTAFADLAPSPAFWAGLCWAVGFYFCLPATVIGGLVFLLVYLPLRFGAWALRRAAIRVFGGGASGGAGASAKY